MKAYSSLNRKRDNFLRALSNLKKAFDERYPAEDDFTQTGLIAHFELCFEQAWKATRAKLIEEGYSKENINSPRSVFKTAYQENLITDEETWVEILKTRNKGTHIYDADLAKEIVEKIKDSFLPVLIQLGDKL